jgi:hypothetical protein
VFVLLTTKANKKSVEKGFRHLDRPDSWHQKNTIICIGLLPKKNTPACWAIACVQSGYFQFNFPKLLAN